MIRLEVSKVLYVAGKVEDDSIGCLAQVACTFFPFNFVVCRAN